MNFIGFQFSKHCLVPLCATLALVGCGGSSNRATVVEQPEVTLDQPEVILDQGPVPVVADETQDVTGGEGQSATPGSEIPIPQDIVSVDVTGGTYVPSDFISVDVSDSTYVPIDLTPSSVSIGDIDQIIFDDSGIILLPRSALSDALNEPGAIRQLLLDGSGIDFPQAASWTFDVLNNSDTISQLLYIRFGFYLPPGSSYVNIVVGDETSFIEQFVERYFGDFEPTSDTGDVISDIITTSSSFSTISSSGTTY